MGRSRDRLTKLDRSVVTINNYCFYEGAGCQAVFLFVTLMFIKEQVCKANVSLMCRVMVCILCCNVLVCVL